MQLNTQNLKNGLAGQRQHARHAVAVSAESATAAGGLASGSSEFANGEAGKVVMGQAVARRRSAEVVAAVVTPCQEVGVVDPVAMGRLCREIVGHGCDGLFVVASTGESVLLDEEDRRSLTMAAREAVGSSATLYVGVAGMGSKQTLRYARNAAADGADVAVVMAPFFMKMSQREVAAYLLDIAEASPIPIALYHHPRMTTAIDVDTVVLLARHANVVAIKDTSTSVERVARLIEATASTEIAILQGNESLVHESLKLGAHGMVTALAGVMPEWHLKLLQAVKGKQSTAATDAHAQIVELWKMFRFDEVSGSISAFACAIKLALRRRGWLERLEGMLPGFVPDAAFERLISEHLAKVGVPGHDGRALRLDLPHELLADPSATGARGLAAEGALSGERGLAGDQSAIA